MNRVQHFERLRIVHFGVWFLCHGFVLKRYLGRLRVKVYINWLLSRLNYWVYRVEG